MQNAEMLLGRIEGDPVLAAPRVNIALQVLEFATYVSVRRRRHKAVICRQIVCELGCAESFLQEWCVNAVEEHIPQRRAEDCPLEYLVFCSKLC